MKAESSPSGSEVDARAVGCSLIQYVLSLKTLLSLEVALE